MGLRVWAATTAVCRLLGAKGGELRPDCLRGARGRILELGCGIGVLGCALATLPGLIQRPEGEVTLTDIDETCLRVARVNVALNNAEGVVRGCRTHAQYHIVNPRSVEKLRVRSG